MANVKTTIDEWEVKDQEDNSCISVYVSHQTEMGNKSLPGLQVLCAGKIVNYEPLHVERWLYAARKTTKRNFCWKTVHGLFMTTRILNSSW